MAPISLLKLQLLLNLNYKVFGSLLRDDNYIDC